MQLKNLLLPLALTATSVVAAPAEDPVTVAEHANIEKRCHDCVNTGAIRQLVSHAISTYASSGYCDQVLGVLAGKFKAKFSASKIQQAISTEGGTSLEKGFCRTDVVTEKEDAQALLTACDATENKRTSTTNYSPAMPEMREEEESSEEEEGSSQTGSSGITSVGGSDCQKVYVPKEHCGGSACICWTNHVQLPTWCKPCGPGGDCD